MPLSRPTAIALSLLVGAASGLAQQSGSAPLAPNAIKLPIIGNTVGSIRTAVIGGTGEMFGGDVHALGDVNGDGIADWIVSRVRCDTLLPTLNNPRYPRELLLYYGRRGALPPVESGVRVGATELGSRSSFVACGDFDDDGFRDLVLAIHVYLDSSAGNTAGWSIQNVATFWGNAGGTFDVRDTTRMASGEEMWLGIHGSFAADIDRDGADDLLIGTEYAFSAGDRVRQPDLRIFKGFLNKRWGRSPDAPRMATWQMWNAPDYDQVRSGGPVVLDHDCDGGLDIALSYSDAGNPARVSIVYGTAGSFPDTSSVESIELSAINGLASNLSDVTGDGVVDLVANCGTDGTLRLFAGRPHQRLRQQYGSGNDEPLDGQGWWRRPWAEIWTPDRLNDDWLQAGFDPLFRVGDMDGDGRDEAWLLSFPNLLGYQCGTGIDSLADAWFAIPGTEISDVTRLGDVDGSGMPTVAISYDVAPKDPSAPFPGAIQFVRGSNSIPKAFGSARRQLPHLLGEACSQHSGVTPPHSNGNTTTAIRDNVRVTYRRSSNNVTVSFAIVPHSLQGVARVAFYALNGECILTKPLPTIPRELTISLSNPLPPPLFCVITTGLLTYSVVVDVLP